jgi:hypothetical protein
MKTQAIIATTHIDAHNEKLTREALEKAAESVNSGNKPVLMLDHDITIPPHGKMLCARVEKRDDGEYQLVSEEEIFEETEWLLFNDGTRLFREESKSNRTPFVDRYEGFQSDCYEVSVDAINFDSFESQDAFFSEVKSPTDVDFTHGEFGRKAAIPDPEIIIKLAQTIVAYLLVTDAVKKIADKVLDKVGDAIADDVVKFYEFTKATIVKYAKYVRPRGRPITYIFVVPRQPQIEFVARTSDPNLVLSAIVIEKLKAAMSNAEHLEKTLGAAQIQYLLNEKGEWEFNYLLTKTGGVVGSEKAFSNRSRKFEMMFPAEKSSKRKKQ